MPALFFILYFKIRKSIFFVAFYEFIRLFIYREVNHMMIAFHKIISRKVAPGVYHGPPIFFYQSKSLNSNTSFEFTASNEVSIINNKSVKVGRVVYVAVKIKIESKLTTDSILNFADIAKNQSTTFLIGKGSEWNIDSVVYGYISGNSILINNSQETISAGDFLHINTVLIL